MWSDIKSDLATHWIISLKWWHVKVNLLRDYDTVLIALFVDDHSHFKRLFLIFGFKFESQLQAANNKATRNRDCQNEYTLTKIYFTTDLSDFSKHFIILITIEIHNRYLNLSSFNRILILARKHHLGKCTTSYFEYFQNGNSYNAVKLDAAYSLRIIRNVLTNGKPSSHLYWKYHTFKKFRKFLKFLLYICFYMCRTLFAWFMISSFISSFTVVDKTSK